MLCPQLLEKCLFEQRFCLLLFHDPNLRNFTINLSLNSVPKSLSLRSKLCSSGQKMRTDGPSNLPLCLSLLDIQLLSGLCGTDYTGSGILLYTFLCLFALDSVMELSHFILQLILWFPKPPWKYASYKSQISKINYLLMLLCVYGLDWDMQSLYFQLKNGKAISDTMISSEKIL